MTAEDAVYAEWLNLLGSDTDEPPAVAAGLHVLSLRAQASHDPELLDHYADLRDRIAIGTEY